MRALFAASERGQGFTASGLERVADSVCGCKLSVFADQIRNASLIDMKPLAARMGFRLMVDSIPAADSTGPLPDSRFGLDFTRTSGPPRLVVRNPETMLRRASRTGDFLIAIHGAPIANIYDLSLRLRGLRVGDNAAVDISATAGQCISSCASLVTCSRASGLSRIRMRRPAQRLARSRWLSGF